MGGARTHADLLGPHLDVEDADVLPAVAAEYEALFKKASKHGSMAGVTFMAPWHVGALDPDDRPALLTSAGLPLRIVYKASRRRFDRLVDAAFGHLAAVA